MNTTPARTQPGRGSVVAAMNWMGGLALLLFWLPVAGPLIAGLVGGWKAGSVKRALVAVFLPGLLVGLLAFVGVTWLTHAVFWGVLAGLGGVVVSLLNIGPLLVGAVAGGVAAQLLPNRGVTP